MKLNPDCIRDILLECEEKCTPYKNTVFKGHSSFVHNGNTYSYEETLYHLRQCSMNNYFSRFTEDWSGNFVVKDLTPIAHEFLANIRHADIWEKTKSIAKKNWCFIFKRIDAIVS